jgi:ankyrin repeat protein
MKTQLLKNVKDFSLIFVVMGALIIGACHQSSNKSDGETTKEEIVKSPKMDLHTAIVMGNLSMINNHIAYGSDLNVKEPMAGSTPMISAALFGKTEIIKLLIDAGADVNATNNENSTALHTAAFFCHQDIVKLLIENNIDQSVRNVHGSTALESVQAPFEVVKPVYEFLNKELKPLGINIDYDQMKAQRPVIAEMLSE